MADTPLNSTQTRVAPSRTGSRTRAVVGTIAGLALLSGLAFAIVRFGIQNDVYTVSEDFNYTAEQLNDFNSPLGSHDGSITATAEGQLVLATAPERPEHLTSLPFRENPDQSTTRRLPFSRSDLEVHSICTDSERDLVRGFRIGFDGEPIPQGGATTILAEAQPIDSLGLNDLRVRTGPGANNILHRVSWEVYGEGGDIAIQSAPVVEDTQFPRQVSFSSTDPSVAVVYPNGQILPISPGTTRIQGEFCDTVSVTSIVLTVSETKDKQLTWHAADALDTRFLDGSITSGPLSADLPEGRIIEGVEADIEVNIDDFDLFAEDGTPKGTYTLFLSANGGTNWAGPFDITSQLSPNDNVATVNINFPEGGQGNDLRYALRMTHDETLARVDDSPAWTGANRGAEQPQDSPLASWWDTLSTPFAHAQQAFEPTARTFVNLAGLAALGEGDPNDRLNPDSLHFLARTFDITTAREALEESLKKQTVPDLFTRATFTTVGATRDIGVFFAPSASDDVLNNVQPTWEFTGNGANNAAPTVSTRNTTTPVTLIPTTFDLGNAPDEAIELFTRDLPTLQVTGENVGFAELRASVNAGILNANVNEFDDLSVVAPDMRVVTLPETTLNVESITFAARLTPGEVPPADEPDDPEDPVDPCVEEVEELREQGVPEEDLPLCDPEEIDEELEGDFEIDPRIIHRGESGGGQRVIVKWGYKDADKQAELVAAAEAGEPLEDFGFVYKSQNGPDALKDVDVYYDVQDEETPFYAVLTGLNGGQTCVESDFVRCGRGTYMYRVTTNGTESDDLKFETLNRLQTIMYDYELIFGDQLRSQGLDVAEVETLEELVAVQEGNADLSGRIEGMQFFHDPRNLNEDATANPMSLSGVKFAIMNDRRFNEHSSRLLATERRRGVARAVEHIYSAVHDRIYVEDLYKICDDEGCDFWADQVTQENVDRIDLDGVALAVLLSEEYSGVQAAIAADVNKFNADYSYQTVLKRGGDEGGVANLAEQYGQADDPLTQMRYALALSDEFKNRISTINTDLGRSEAITELYESCFFRASDVEGVAYWSEERSDLTVDELRVNFCEEGEGTGSL